MKKLLNFVLYLIVAIITWISLLVVNHFVLVELSLVNFKERGASEVESYTGHSFDILAILTLLYVLLFFIKFFYFKEKRWISYLSIGLWIITFLIVYLWNL